MEEGKNEGAADGDGENMEIAYSDHPMVVENVKPPLANDGQIEIDLAPKLLSTAENMQEELDQPGKEVEEGSEGQVLPDLSDGKIISETADVLIVKSNIEESAGHLGSSVNKISSLSVIANYGSDSYDSDDNDNADETVVSETVNTPTPPVIDLEAISAPMDFQTTEYRKVQPSSDDSESDSSASSDDDSSSSSSTESFDGLAAKNNEVAAAVEVPDSNQKPPRTKGETLLSDLPPIADLQISVAEASCLEMGFITSIVDSQVVVHAKPNIRALNLETVLFLDKGKRPLGVIFDVFGQVTEPFYSVRFNSAEHVKDKNIEVGMVVYCAPDSEHTNYVFVDELLKVRGTDSSWEDNNETPVELLDFSDDEAEMNAHRSKLRNARNQGGSGSFDNDQPPRKRVNSFERRMNERNLQKSALPPEPRNPFAGTTRGAANARAKRTTGFAGQQRPVRPAHEPVFPSPFVGGQQMAHRPRPAQLSWDMVTVQGQGGDQPMAMGYMHSPVNTQPMRPGGMAGPFQPRNRPYAQGRGYGFGPFPSSRMFPMSNVQSPPPMRYPPTNGQPVVQHAALAYTMGSPMQPNPGNQGYQTGYMQHNGQQAPFPVLLRPATFQGGPPRYDTGYPQSMPFGSRPPAFPPGCYQARPSAGPPQPPMRGQPYNPMFSGMALFNPGFPPPQLPPRGSMFPIGPPPPPRGGV